MRRIVHNYSDKWTEKSIVIGDFRTFSRIFKGLSTSINKEIKVWTGEYM